MDLEPIIDAIIKKPTQSPDRLRALADCVIDQLKLHGLPGAIGGSTGELRVAGLARKKDWDVAYDFAGKFRLLISLKSMWKNAAGTIPNRLDDHMGEIANIQQLRPEIVIGYVVLFDLVADSRRKDGILWSDYFEQALKKIAIRKAPSGTKVCLKATGLFDLTVRNRSASGFSILRQSHRKEPTFSTPSCRS